MNQALKEGKVTGEEMARGIATSIPVLGDFVAGFLNVRELLTGEKAEIEAIKKEAEETLKVSEAQVKVAQTYRDTLREVGTASAKANLAAWA